jgi:hypothetical protein
MHVVVRSYSGQAGSDLMDALTQNEDEVTALISGVPGFVSYVSFSHRRRWRDHRDRL